MAFVLQDVIEELERFHSLDPIKRELRLAELKEAHELHELKAEHENALLEAEIEAKKEAAAREHELKMHPMMLIVSVRICLLQLFK